MSHQHEWRSYCDCRDHLAEEDRRDCCCVGGSACLVHPIEICATCGARKGD